VLDDEGQLTSAAPVRHLPAKGRRDAALVGSWVSRWSRRMRHASADGFGGAALPSWLNIVADEETGGGESALSGVRAGAMGAGIAQNPHECGAAEA